MLDDTPELGRNLAGTLPELRRNSAGTSSHTTRKHASAGASARPLTRPLLMNHEAMQYLRMVTEPNFVREASDTKLEKAAALLREYKDAYEVPLDAFGAPVVPGCIVRVVGECGTFYKINFFRRREDGRFDLGATRVRLIDGGVAGISSMGPFVKGAVRLDEVPALDQYGSDQYGRDCAHKYDLIDWWRSVGRGARWDREPPEINFDAFEAGDEPVAEVAGAIEAFIGEDLYEARPLLVNSNVESLRRAAADDCTACHVCGVGCRRLAMRTCGEIVPTIVVPRGATVKLRYHVWRSLGFDRVRAQCALCALELPRRRTLLRLLRNHIRGVYVFMSLYMKIFDPNLTFDSDMKLSVQPGKKPRLHMAESEAAIGAEKREQ